MTALETRANTVTKGQCTVLQSGLDTTANSLIKRDGIVQMQLRLLKNEETTLQYNIGTIPAGFRPIQAIDVLVNDWTTASYPLQYRLNTDGSIICLNGNITALRIDIYLSAVYLSNI